MPKIKNIALVDGPQGQLNQAIDAFSVAILNSLSSHICVVDGTGEIIAINRAWTEFAEENGGNSELLSEGSNYFSACQQAIDSDGSQDAEKAVSGIRSVLKGEAEQFEMEYDCHSPQEKRWFIMRVSPLQYHGRKAVVSHIDISEKKRSEMELAALHSINQSVSECISLEGVTQRILEQVSSVIKPDLCFIFLRDGDQLKLKGAYPDDLLFRSAADPIHRVGDCLCGLSVSVAEPIFSQDINSDQRCSYRECKEAGISSFAAVPLIRKGTAIGTIGLASYAARDFSVNQRFLESVALDIAIVLENSLLFEQVSKSAIDLERELARQQELEAQLVQVQKMDAIGTLAGGIAHDFNNLLAIIKGNISILQVKVLSQQDIGLKVEQINKAVDRATDLVRQILSFSRQKSLSSEPIDLNLAVNEDMKFLRSTIPTTVEIFKTLNSDPIIINADNTQLQQVLINLCNNAVQAMNGKGLLTLSLKELTLDAEQLPNGANIAPGRFARLSLSDTGSGMDRETLSRIFDPFFTTKDVRSGTGLGLSVVHGIVRSHGGFITVDSEPGKGTTFHLFFPVYQGLKDQSAKSQVDAPPRGTEKILLVDDEEYLVTLYSEMFEHLGYQVTSATGSSYALDLFKRDPQAFDLVFTDQTMPQMSGVELAAELLKIRADIPIILCSGYSAAVSDKKLKDHGISKFCMKPMSMQTLAISAREVLDAAPPAG